MGPKRKNASGSSGVGETKRVRRPLNVAKKLDILARLEKGERSKDICVALNLSSSTVRTIYLQKDNLMKVAATSVGGVKLERITRTRDSIMSKLERVLTHWIDRHNRRNVDLTFHAIQQKALSLFEELKQNAEIEGVCGAEDLEFKASHGWFDRFKSRANLRSFRVSSEKVIAADAEAARSFPEEVQKVIEDGGYSPKQIFNLDESGLLWKRMPSRTFIKRDEQRAPGFNASKDRLTLLLGGNLEGDVKLKPLSVYNSLNPRALKGIKKETLPVIWRYNKNGWVTKALFAEYVKSYLSPFIASYCAKQNLHNKALLIIDTDPGHSEDAEDYADNIRVIFLPPNTGSLLQPMCQGVIDIFKAHYLQLLMRYLVAGSSDDHNKLTVQQLWSDYNVKMAVDNIGAAWSRITQQNMNGVWRALLPARVRDIQDFQAIVEGIQHEIANLAFDAGIEFDQSDVQETGDEEECAETTKTLDIKTLSLLFTTCQRAIQIVEDSDPQMDRSSVFKRKVNDAIACYQELYKSQKKASKKKKGKSVDEVCHSQQPDGIRPPTSADSRWAQPSTSAESRWTQPSMAAEFAQFASQM